MEYWELEQAKLRKAGSAPAFQGEVALITGAASGIGKACADSMLQRGAAVVGLDRNPAISQLFPEQAFLGIQCDVTDTPGTATGALRHLLEIRRSRYAGAECGYLSVRL